MWVVLTAALLYLEVPLRNAPQFAAVLMSQACLGGLIITRLLKDASLSVLLLFGPGLILGGSVSFVVFQVAGRGTAGEISTIAVNFMSLLMVLFKGRWAKSDSNWWSIVQLLGLAATALNSEHKELLPIALLVFVIGFLSDPARPTSRPLLVGSSVIAAIVLVVTLAQRQKYWWLITDDYQYFEVISRHLIKSSPFADWGVESFLKYHWLPYGWSGLLGILGGNPQPFVTLTRVMPLVYSLSLAAGLMLTSTLFNRRTFTFRGLTPVWVIIILVELDWAGTGTAGVFAVLASLIFFLVLSIQSRQSLTPKLVLVGAFLIILLLTKLPSIFVVVLITSATALTRALGAFSRRQFRLVSQLAGVVASIFMTIGIAWMGTLLLNNYEFATINRQLGQLADSGKLFAVPILALSRSVIWAAVIYACVLTLQERRRVGARRVSYLPALCAALFVGSTLEVIIQSNADNHRYFSVPMFFVASLSMLLVEPLETRMQSNALKLSHLSLLQLAVFVVAALWNRSRAGSLTLEYLDRGLSVIPGLELHTAQNYFLNLLSNDLRLIAVVAGSLIAIGVWLTGRSVSYSDLLLLPIALLSLLPLINVSISTYQESVSLARIEMNLGSNESRSVGEFIRVSSGESDLVATNHLFDPSGNPLSDFSLAVWAEREFLILGPRFGGEIIGRKSEAIENSMQFADSPTTDTCRPLEEAGVRWFVVDLQLTDTREWSVCAEEVFRAGDFILLSMRYPRFDSL
jgi:hypothetical protein